MGSLGDALHKAGLISEDDRKRQEHQRNSGGRGAQGSGGRGSRGGRGRGRGRGQGGPSAAGAPQRLIRPAARPQDLDIAVIEVASQLIDENALDKELGGRKRWHFETLNGELPFVAVNDRVMRQLESGERALGQGHSAVRLIDAETASKAMASDPSSVLFWTQNGQ